MISPAANPPRLSKIATKSGWRRFCLAATGTGVALALGVASVFAQESANSNKKSAEFEDIDAALDAFTSPDPAFTPASPSGLPVSLFPPLGPPVGFFPNRFGSYGPSLFNSYFPATAFGQPFPNGYPIAAIGPQGTPLATPTPFGSPGSINASDAYAGGNSFDVLKQPSEFKYTGSEIGLLYGFSTSGASIRAAGFVTSIASNTTQIYLGATFSDQSGLPFNPLFQNRKPKFSAQTQQYFGGLNYKLAGGSMLLGIEFAVDNTKLSGNFRPFNRINQPVTAVSNPNNIGNGNTYGGQINLSGVLPNNTGYQVGVGVDQSNGPDVTSLFSTRRR